MDDWFRPRSRKPFSSSEWANSAFGDIARYRMANDLVQSKRLVYASESDLRSLLGRPGIEETNGTVKRLCYDLTSQRVMPAKCLLIPYYLFFNTDTWELEVQCENGKVKKARIRST